jgi:hypothetical protein
MERKDLIKNLWHLSQYCDSNDLKRFTGYIECNGCSSSENWILEPGERIRVGEREGIISQLIADNMNEEVRSKVFVTFGLYNEETFLTEEPLTKENCDSFLVFNKDKSMQMVAKRLKDNLDRETIIDD